MQTLLSLLLLLLAVSTLAAQPRRGDSPSPRRSPDTAVVLVNGNPIPWSSYNDLLSDQRNYQRTQLGQDTALNPAIRDQLLMQLIDGELMRQEAARRGCALDVAAAKAFLIQNPPDFIRQNFLDQSGTYQGEIFRQVVLTPESIVNYVQVPSKTREQIIRDWKVDLGKLVRYIQTEETRRCLIDSLFAAKPLTHEAIRARYMAERTRFDGSFIRILHTTIPDSLVPISDEEAERWYNEHRDDYRFPAQRELAAWIIPVDPLPSDSAAQRSRLDGIRESIMKASPADRAAAVERAARSLGPGRFPSEPIAIDRIPREIRPQVAAAKPGDLIGPFQTSDEGDLSYFYVRGVSPVRDTVVRVRHILLKVEGAEADADEVMRRFADTLRAQLTSEKAFSDAALVYSSDASKAEGGDLGYIGRGITVREFDSAIYAGEVGRAIGPVRTQFGYHLIWITDRSNTGYRMQELRVPLIRIGGAAEKRVMADAQALARALSVNDPAADSIQRVIRQRYPMTVADTTTLGQLDLYGDGITANQFAFTAERGDAALIPLGGNRVMVAQRLRSWPASNAPLKAVKVNFVVPQARRARQMEMLKPNVQGARDTMTADMMLGIIRLKAPLAEAFMVREQPLSSPPDEEVTILDSLVERTPEMGVSGPVRGQHGYYFLRVVKKNYVPSESDWQGDRMGYSTEYTERYRKQLADELLAKLRRDAVVQDRRPFAGTLYRAVGSPR